MVRRTSGVMLDPYGFPGSDGVTTHWKDQNGCQLAAVTLSEDVDSSPAKLVNVLAHEAFHVTTLCVQAMGDESPSEEMLAYTTGYIAEALFEDYMAWRAHTLKWLAP